MTHVLEELSVDVIIAWCFAGLIDFSAVSTSSKVEASDIEVDSGVELRRFFISEFTEREWILAHWFYLATFYR